MQPKTSEPTDSASGLAAALRAIGEKTFKSPPANSFTTRDYADARGCDMNTARRQIEALVRLKKAKPVGSFSVYDNSNNRKQFTPHFQLTAKK